VLKTRVKKAALAYVITIPFTAFSLLSAFWIAYYFLHISFFLKGLKPPLDYMKLASFFEKKT